MQFYLRLNDDKSYTITPSTMLIQELFLIGEDEMDVVKITAIVRSGA